MNLKQYTHQPDPGLFDTIQRRLRRRRLIRVGNAVAAAVAVCGVAAALLLGRPAADEDAVQLASAQPLPSVSTQAPVAAAQPAADPQAPSQAASLAARQPEPSAVSAAATAAPSQPAAIASATPSVPSAQSPSAAVTPKAAAPAAVQPSVMAEAPARSTDTSNSSLLIPHSSPLTPHSPLPTPASKSEVETDGVDVWAPNVIVPDGDVEENRTFGLRFSSEVSDFKLYIFNRNGRQLLYTGDPLFRWDGTCNGTRLPQGAYVWVAQFRDSKGNPVQKKGTVTLLR